MDTRDDRGRWALVAEVAYLGLSLGVASLSFYLLERPFLRLKQRFNSNIENADGTAAV